MTLDLTMGQYLQYVILPYVGIFSIIVFPAFFFIFWKWMMPSESKMLYRAKRQNKPPLLVVDDAGRGQFTLITERRENGVVMTEGGKYKFLPRYVSKESPPEPTEAQKADPNYVPGNPKSYDKIYTDYVTKRCQMKGLGLPLFVGYSGSLNLLNPDALALYEAGEMMVPTTESVMFNPKNVEGKRMTKGTLQPVQLLDIRKITEIINLQYDPTQFAAAIEDAKLEERLGKGLGRFKGMFIIIALVVAVIAVVFLLPSLME